MSHPHRTQRQQQRAPIPPAAAWRFCAVWLVCLGLVGCKAGARGLADLSELQPADLLQADKHEAAVAGAAPLPLPPPPMEAQRRFSLSFQEAPLSDVLYALSQETQLNVTVDSDVDLGRRLTVHLNDVSFEQALDMVVVRGAGYAWTVDGGFLSISRFMQRIYHLDYLDLPSDTEIEVGGDMLASGVSEAGVAGRFTVSSEKKGDESGVWVNIQLALEAMGSKEGTLWIDKNVGMIYLSDTPQRVATMTAWLDDLKASLHREVFMEAKILEVRLSRGHKYGIDWSSLSVDFTSDLKSLPDSLGIGVNGGSSFVLSNATRIDALLDFLQTQGDVRILSNPHLSVMNGQTAVMTVGYQFPFGDVEGVDRDPETGTTTFITSIKRAVLGLQLGISAQISPEGVVSMHIVPTITRIQRSEDVEIPTTSTRTQTISNPVIDLQELATLVRVREGNPVVLGGLISQVDSLDKSGLPLLYRIPGLGALFGHTARNQETRELVVVITPYLKKVP